MGRTSRWFRSLLGFKKSSASDSGKAKDKKSKSGGNNGSVSSESSTHPYVLDANKHAIAVAAATAAVAEAALAAAHAAAEVVRLTTGGSRATATAANYATSVNTDRRRHLAAVIIQSGFRAYLSRRALKALKGLVKLQALVRGHIVRKQSTHMLHRMQAMARIQAQACAHRAYLSESPYSSSKSSHTQQPDLAYIKMFDHQYGAPGNRRRNGSPLKRSVSKSSTKENIDREKTYVGSTWLDKWMEENSANKHRSTLTTNGYGDGEMGDKILEVDTWKPRMNRDTSHHVSAWNHNEPIFIPFDALSTHSTKSQKPTRSPSPLEFSSFSSLKVNQAAGMAGNSPGTCSASSRTGSCYKGGPSTPTRSECSQSFFSSYMGYPSYMAYTQSSQAKVRSRSAPRQRMDSEKPGSVKRFVRGYWDEETSSESGWPLHANFSTTAYPGTDSFDNFGVPDQGDAMRYGSAYCGR